MPIRIIQIQDASMGPPSEVSLVTTGADRLSFLIPSEYVRGDLNNTFAACLEALDCDMNAETGRDIHSITAQCENNACQEQRVRATLSRFLLLFNVHSLFNCYMVDCRDGRWLFQSCYVSELDPT